MYKCNFGLASRVHWLSQCSTHALGGHSSISGQHICPSCGLIPQWKLLTLSLSQLPYHSLSWSD